VRLREQYQNHFIKAGAAEDAKEAEAAAIAEARDTPTTIPTRNKNNAAKNNIFFCTRPCQVDR
jgi:hypothetical protein